MNNPFLKSNKNAFKFCIAFLITFVSVLYSCRKDHVNQTANPQALTTIDAHIPQLKELYANGVKAHSKATQSTGKWYNDLINSIEVDWNSYTLQKRNDSSIVAEFEMKNDSGLYTLKQLDGKYRNKTTVVFIEHQDGSRLSFFAKVIEDLSIPGSETVMDELHYRNIPGLFNGMIFYYTLDRQFVNGERYVNGVRTGSVSFKETASGIKVNSKGVNNVVAPCTITDFYSYNCQKLPSGELIDCVYHYLGSVESGNCHGDGDGGSGGYGGDGSGGGVPADPKPCIPAKPNTVDMTEVVKNGKLVIQSMPAPGTGGGTTPTPTPVPCPTTPPPVTPVITNNVNDPCLKKMVDATIGANVNNEINKLIQGVFGNSNKLNLSFTDAALDNRIDGHTSINGGFDANGNLNIIIELNKNTMPSFSQQYISRVIMHEAIHAYLTSTGTLVKLQHEDMVENYIAKMATSLQSMYPGLSVNDAKNLSLGGLQVSDAFRNTIATNMGLLGSFAAVNTAYSIGSSGKRCN